VNVNGGAIALGHPVGSTGARLLTTALHDVGYVQTDRDPDYVVLGETRTYSFEAITKAIRLIDGGARFIATNPDASGPSQQGKLPATGAVAAAGAAVGDGCCWHALSASMLAAVTSASANFVDGRERISMRHLCDCRS
jgi:hypothetical protein